LGIIGLITSIATQGLTQVCGTPIDESVFNINNAIMIIIIIVDNIKAIRKPEAQIH
jgi:hypothetical protein